MAVNIIDDGVRLQVARTLAARQQGANPRRRNIQRRHREGDEAAGRRIFEKILSVASGEHTLSEDFGFGDNEFVPWQIGAVT